MLVQLVIALLSFVNIGYFVMEGVIGFMLVFALYMAYHQLSYSSLIFTFISIYFAITFLVYFLTPIQQGTTISSLPFIEFFAIIMAAISAVYYTLAAIFAYYPYNEFKITAFDDMNRAVKQYY